MGKLWEKIPGQNVDLKFVLKSIFNVYKKIRKILSFTIKRKNGCLESRIQTFKRIAARRSVQSILKAKYFIVCKIAKVN